MNKLKIGIVGSRRRNSSGDLKLLLMKILDLVADFYKRKMVVGYELGESISHYKKRLEKFYPNTEIVTGDCNEGGDKFAREDVPKYFNKINIDIKRIRDPETGEEMDFNNHRWFEYDIMCNIFYSRNEEIAKEPLNYLVALVAPDRKGGTENTIKYFKQYHNDWEEKLIVI